METHNLVERMKPSLSSHQMRTKLRRLCRVKTELMVDGQPVPPELDEKIREVYAALATEEQRAAA